MSDMQDGPAASGVSPAIVAIVKRPIPSAALVRLFEQAARALHAMGHEDGLFPAQWTALRYFASTPDPAQRNAMALARFHGVAFGPVTRTVRTLIAKGYLVRAGSGGRGRTTRLDLTIKGRKILAHDPLQVFMEAIESLSESEREGLAIALERLVRAAHAYRAPAEEENRKSAARPKPRG